MCKILFKRDESDIIPWANEVKVFRNTNGTESVINFFLDDNFKESDPDLYYLTLGDDSRISWFEFCMNNLPERLWDKNHECYSMECSPCWSDYYKWFFNGLCPNIKEYTGHDLIKHPIDFLYEEFKSDYFKYCRII